MHSHLRSDVVIEQYLVLLLLARLSCGESILLDIGLWKDRAMIYFKS